MKVLMCGGRDFNNVDLVVAAFNDHPNISLVIEGGAKGADTIARMEAQQRCIHVATVPALWEQLGRNAGWRRNNAMLSLEPDLVIAFPGGRGTNNMIEIAKRAGIEVKYYD